MQQVSQRLMYHFGFPSQVSNSEVNDQKPETSSLASNLTMSEESKYHILCTMEEVFLWPGDAILL